MLLNFTYAFKIYRLKNQIIFAHMLLDEVMTHFEFTTFYSKENKRKEKPTTDAFML